MEGHIRWLEQAIALAVENVNRTRGGPFGAVVVKDDTVIATGVNVVTSNFDPTAHAEIVAIREACRKLGTHQLDGCDLYCSCEPCPMCLGAIYWARPRAYYFACTRESAAEAGFDDTYIHGEFALSPEKRGIAGHCIAVTGQDAPFVEWAQNVGRVRY